MTNTSNIELCSMSVSSDDISRSDNDSVEFTDLTKIAMAVAQVVENLPENEVSETTRPTSAVNGADDGADVGADDEEEGLCLDAGVRVKVCDLPFYMGH